MRVLLPLVSLLTLHIATDAAAITCTLVADGTWETPASWSNCAGSYPIPGDTIIIDTNHKVTLTQDREAFVLTQSDGEIALGGHDLAISSGTMSAGNISGGGTITIKDGVTWTGGLVHGTTLTIINVGHLTTSVGLYPNIINNGRLTFVGAQQNTGTLVNGVTGTIEGVGGLAGNTTNNGVIHVEATGNWATGSLTNNAEINIRGQLGTGAPFTQNDPAATLTLIDGGNLINNTGINIQDGLVHGGGFLQGPVNVTGGLIQVGDEIGTLVVNQPPSGTFNANYTQSGGVLRIQASGLEPGSEHDRLIVLGDVSLGGTTTLQVAALSGFAPSGDEGLDIITFGDDFTGSFTTVSDTTLPISYLAHAVRLGGNTVHTDFHTGDLFLAEPWGLERMTQDGTLVALYSSLDDLTPTDELETDSSARASCFDADGNLYRVRWYGSTLEKYDRHGALVNGAFFTAERVYRCSVDSHGKVYVVADTTVIRLSATGATEQTFAVDADDGVIAPDDCTFAYIKDFHALKAHDVCTDTADTRFDAFVPDLTPSTQDCTTLALHPNGDVFVSCRATSGNATVYRLHEGVIAQRYQHPDMGYPGIFPTHAWSMAIDPSGTSFWIATANGGSKPLTLNQVSIAGGLVKQLHVPFNVIHGIALYGNVSSGTTSGTTAGSTAGATTGATTGDASTGATTGATVGTTTGVTTGTTTGVDTGVDSGTTTTSDGPKKGGCQTADTGAAWLVGLALLARRRARGELAARTVRSPG